MQYCFPLVNPILAPAGKSDGVVDTFCSVLLLPLLPLLCEDMRGQVLL